MLSFEDVRVQLASRYELSDNEPWLVSVTVILPGERRQSVFAAELETESGDRVLRLSTPIGPLGRIDPIKCLRFNWAQRVGWLALSDLDGVPYLQLCENRAYPALDDAGLDGLLLELASQADSLERLHGRERDVA